VINLWHVSQAFPVTTSKVDPASIPAATTFIGTAQTGGIALALVSSTSILVNLATNRLMPLFPSHGREDVVNAISGVDSGLFDELNAEQRVEALNRVNSAIQDVYYLAVACGALLIILALCMKREMIQSRALPSQERAGEETEKSEQP
jgi:hypothetical protein